jgi:hypothetical protein
MRAPICDALGGLRGANGEAMPDASTFAALNAPRYISQYDLRHDLRRDLRALACK